MLRARPAHAVSHQDGEEGRCGGGQGTRGGGDVVRQAAGRADDGERERRRQMRGTAEEEAAAAAIAPPSLAAPAPRKKRAMVTWGAANEAVLAQIDESRRAQVGSQLWAVARAAAASIQRQAGEGARGKRAAEWPADGTGARAQARQRTGDGGSSSSDMRLLAHDVGTNRTRCV